MYNQSLERSKKILDYVEKLKNFHNLYDSNGLTNFFILFFQMNE